MTSFNEVFERKEKKYRLNAHQYEQIKLALAGHMVLDAFGKTEISSLYYDTAERSMIARSLEKPLYKEKLRIRRYKSLEGEQQANEGIKVDATQRACESSQANSALQVDEIPQVKNPTAVPQVNADTTPQTTPTQIVPAIIDGRVFVEMKKKFDGITYKRRVACSEDAAHAYMAGMPYKLACMRYPLENALANEESLSTRSKQIIREIDNCRKRNSKLFPSMIIRCNRCAYQPLNIDSDLRITFDSNLCYKDCFVKGAPYVEMLKTGEIIMEVKCCGALPLWLTNTLSKLRIFSCSFSKYGTAYKMCSTRYSAPKITELETINSKLNTQNDARALNMPTYTKTLNYSSDVLDAQAI